MFKESTNLFKKMTRMNTAKGSHPFIQTSQPILFDDMARMLDPFKCSAITLMPPHNT